MRDQLVENKKIEKKRLIPKQRMQKSRCYLVEKKKDLKKKIWLRQIFSCACAEELDVW